MKTGYMKNALLIIGFLLFVLGILSLVLSMLGLQFQFLAWTDRWGRLIGLVIRLSMIIFGIALAYLGRTDWRQEED